MEYYNLTTPQKNIWNLQKYYEDTAIGTICGAVFYHEKRDSALLQQSVRQFVLNQSGLRLRFVEGKEPKQYVVNEMDDDIPIMEFQSMKDFELYVEKYAKEKIGFADRPLYRFVVFQVEDRSGILVALSHLISDAWTYGLMANQFDRAYHMLLNNTDDALIEGDYIDYIQAEKNYMTSARFEKDKIYWEEKYAKGPEESLIKLHPVPIGTIQAKRITRTIPLPLEEKIAVYCKTYSVTEAVLFEMALLIYLSKVNPENDSITIGVPVLNRSGFREKNIAGMFISTMPLTIKLTGTTPVSELAKQITKEHMDIFRHQKYPYADILKYLREKQSFNGNLYDVMVSYQNAKTDTDAETRWYSNGVSEIPFTLHIDNRDGQSCHTINADYQTAVFQDEAEVYYLIERLEYIIEQIVENSLRTVGEIDIIPGHERKMLVCDFNDTAVDYPKEKCVHELFAEQAEKTPDQVALVFEDKKFTYRQLDEMSNSLAHFLREKGIGRNDVIPIIARRSWHVVVAMLGVLKAGGAYMPVDPDYPGERIGYMLDTAKAEFALQYGCHKDLPIEQIDLGGFDYSVGNEPLDSRNQPEDLCYIVFTSGSTGRPKGVAVYHYNANNYCSNNGHNVCNKIIRNEHRKIVSVTNIIFDIFVTESLLPLLNGLTVYFANDEEAVKQSSLSSLIKNNEIEILQTTPTKMRSYLINKEDTKYLRCLKTIILGGEAFPADLYHELKSYTDADIFNIYGPAETTVWSTNAEVVSDDVTIGTPIANTQIYILDKNQHLLPVGVAGELCIAGEGVGKGYLNRPELTAERFLPNPFATQENGHGKIMYRTGDLARFRADGEIEYLGRIDTQVKIRGLRIELGEIESVMGSFPGIQICAVADKCDESGRQYLVGYYTCQVPVEESELRKHLSGRLPKYMVPNYFMILEAIPMTASGKTDRKNLPMPDFHVQTLGYIAPETEREALCCHFLERILGYEQVGVEDDFFEIGGDSLRAIEYVAKLQDQGVNLDLQNIFDYPTVRKLCDFLKYGAVEQVRYRKEDFEKYQKILKRNVIDGMFHPVKKSLGNIFLTGATGFLGAHILDTLMKEEQGVIYCLVRGGSKEEGKERIRKILQYYFDDTYDSEIGNRIVPITGNIEKEELANGMPSNIKTVIHAAASVKHYGSYSYFEHINVWGTQHVINYAKRAGARLIHISTLSVSGNSMADSFSVYRAEEEKYFAETSFYMEQPLDNVYVRSKFEAEKAVLDAILEGMDAKIIRVGNLTNRASDYKFQPNYHQNAFLTRVKAALEFGFMPDYLLELYSEFSPVDLTAEGIVMIAQYSGSQSVFHLYSNRPIYHDRLLEVLSQLNIHMKIVDQESFNAALKNTMKSMDTEYIYEAFQNDMDENGKLLYDTNIHIENDFTVWFLKQAGFEWNEIDLEYIRGYINYFRNIGFLKV